MSCFGYVFKLNSFEDLAFYVKMKIIHLKFSFLGFICLFVKPYILAEKTPLYILGLYPLSGDWAGGQGQLPATRFGFESVNANEQILPNYEFKLVARNTLVSIKFTTCFVLCYDHYFTLYEWLKGLSAENSLMKETG